MITVTQIDFAKSRDFFIKHKVHLLHVLAMLTVSFAVSVYKSHKLTKYTEFESEMQPLINISANSEKLHFIQKHNFKGKYLNFKDFVNKIAYENCAKISCFENISKTKIEKIDVKLIKLIGLFWHDIFIFNFLEEIQDFSPGFINIVSVEINKFSRQILHKPVLKLEAVCKIFQKS